jgi:hypothetical protein
MSGWHVLGAMVAADVRERTRRTSFLVTLGLLVYLGYAVGAGQVLVHVGDYRGVYNSAWVGGMMALVITFFLGLFGFYLVKGGIARDEASGVGQIIATTPLTRTQYVLGKWLSNLALLSLMVAILAVAAALIQLIRQEDARLQLWPLLAPLLLIALPALALVASLAVLFETIGWLKGGFGNLVYLVLFCLILIAGVQSQSPWLDVLGFNPVGASMKEAAHSAFPEYRGGFVLTMASSRPLETFVWTGIDWTAELVLQRLLWVVVALGLTLASAPLFQRFDMARRRVSRARRSAPPAEQVLASEEAATPGDERPVARLTPLSGERRFQRNTLRLIGLELALLVKGVPWYWLAGAAGLWVGCVVAPAEGVRQLWYMLAALWPVLLWSRLGERDARHHTEALLSHAPHPTGRLLAAAWVAGVLLTGGLLSGVVLGRLLWGESLALLPWALALLFIPTLALTLGTWSRSSKLFEVVYPVLWYLGPMNTQGQLVALDFLGVHGEAPVNTAPLLVLAGVMALLLLAVLGRQRPAVA